MELLDYCLRCYKSLGRKDWETILALPGFWVIRCPRCRALHTCCSDGTVRVTRGSK